MHFFLFFLLFQKVYAQSASSSATLSALLTFVASPSAIPVSSSPAILTISSIPEVSLSISPEPTTHAKVPTQENAKKSPINTITPAIVIPRFFHPFLFSGIIVPKDIANSIQSIKNLYAQNELSLPQTIVLLGVGVVLILGGVLLLLWKPKG